MLIISSIANKDPKSIGLDFDGVLHDYSNGWDGPMPKRQPIEGSLEFVKKLQSSGYEVFIMSSRAKTEDGKDGIKKWLKKHDFPQLEITREKKQAILYIDDRGYRFDGDFDSLIGFIENDISPWYELENKSEKKDIVLKDNKWLQLREIRDPENGVDGYVYSHEKISDGKVVAMLPYRKSSDDYEFLLRSEVTPCWGMQHFVSSTTGKVDKGETPIQTAVRELKEEAGYSVKEKDMIPLGTSFSSKSSDTVNYLFSVDLADKKKGEVTTDGTELEAKAHNFWTDQIESEDPLVAVMFCRLIKNILK